MGEDRLNGGRVLNRGDELHRSGAARTAQDAPTAVNLRADRRRAGDQPGHGGAGGGAVWLVAVGPAQRAAPGAALRAPHTGRFAACRHQKAGPHCRPRPPVSRGQRSHRARGIGSEVLHVAVDDHSRVAYVELLADECAPTVSTPPPAS